MYFLAVFLIFLCILVHFIVFYSLFCCTLCIFFQTPFIFPLFFKKFFSFFLFFSQQKVLSNFFLDSPKYYDIRIFQSSLTHCVTQILQNIHIVIFFLDFSKENNEIINDFIAFHILEKHYK